MGVLRRVADWLDPPPRPIKADMPTLGRAERRDKVSTWDLIRGGGAPPVAAVNPRYAENVGAVFACVDVIASAMASLPVYVYRMNAKTRLEDPGHPLARVVREGANAEQSWADFVEWLMASTLLRGNGVAEIVSDSRGRVVGLQPIPFDYVQVQQLRSGALVYDIVEHIGLFGATGRPRRLLAGEVLHVRDRTDDGLLGRSRLSRAAAVVRASAAIQQTATDLYENGLQIRGALESEREIAMPAKREMREDFESLYRGPTGHKVAILDQAVKFKDISMTAEDAELLKGREFSVSEIARLFRVPPPLIQDYSKNTFTNAEQAGRWLAMITLLPWCVKLGAAFKKQALSGADRETHEVDFDLSGIMRGDFQARWAAHKTAVDGRILTRNEVRAIEGFNPVPGGDEFDAPRAAPQVQP